MEGYPGLIFHGPLTATLLLGLAADEAGAEALRRFDFRAVSPLFGNAPFSIGGVRENGAMHVWAGNPDGKLAMAGTAKVDA